MERRSFLAATATLAGAPFVLRGADPAPSGRITLLHTNDTHSRIEPFGPGMGSLTGRGGIARRATLVRQLRKDLEMVQHFADAMGSPSPMLGQALALYRRLIEAGHAELDTSSVFRLYDERLI